MGPARQGRVFRATEIPVREAPGRAARGPTPPACRKRSASGLGFGPSGPGGNQEKSRIVLGSPDSRVRRGTDFGAGAGSNVVIRGRRAMATSSAAVATWGASTFAAEVFGRGLALVVGPHPVRPAWPPHVARSFRQQLGHESPNLRASQSHPAGAVEPMLATTHRGRMPAARRPRATLPKPGLLLRTLRPRGRRVARDRSGDGL